MASSSKPNFSAPLPRAVFRFAPEPSGYLHIGHVKAVLLNDKLVTKNRAHGAKFILRFDDTNPQRVRRKNVESMQKDLELLGIHFDQVTYSSDSFDYLISLTEAMIAAGLLYADNSSAEEMKLQRKGKVGTASKCRHNRPEEKFIHWKEMLTGSEEGQKYVLRAKIDLTSSNKTLWDPVVYRCRPVSAGFPPHFRTGDKITFIQPTILPVPLLT